MAKFLSTIPALNTAMTIGGTTHYFNFTPKGNPFTYGYLYVNDPKEIAALKKHPYFGCIITLEEEPAVATAETKKVEEKQYAASYPEVTKSQDAIAILVNKHDVDAATLTSKAIVKKTAETLNIDFPNLK